MLGGGDATLKATYGSYAYASIYNVSSKKAQLMIVIHVTYIIYIMHTLPKLHLIRYNRIHRTEFLKAATDGLSTILRMQHCCQLLKNKLFSFLS